MKKYLYLLIVIFLVLSAGVFSQTIKKFPLKKFELKSTATSSSKPTIAPARPEIILPPLPKGQKRVDVNVIREEFYECPKCEREYSKAGKCLFDSAVLVKKTRSFTYKCKQCGFMRENPGNCPICKGHPPLRKFEVRYIDVNCKIEFSEPGLCPKCKQPLKRNTSVEIKTGK